jgi:hypothetical protein
VSRRQLGLDHAPSIGGASEPRRGGWRGRAARQAAYWLLLAGLALVGYAANLRDFFVADDFSNLFVLGRATSVLQAMDPRGELVQELFLKIYPGGSLQRTFLRPLTGASMWLTHAASGLDPLGYHAAALALHVVNAGLVGALARALGAAPVPAMVAAAAFAVFPTHPEAVVWVAARADVLVATMMGGAVLALLRYARAGGVPWLAVGLSFYGAGLATKEMAVTVPALAACCAVGVRAPWRRVAVILGAGALALAAYLGARVHFLGGLGGYGGGAELSLAWSHIASFYRAALLYAVLPGNRDLFPGPDALRLIAAAGLAVVVACGFARAGWRSGIRAACACAACYVLCGTPVATWGSLPPNTEGSRFLYPMLMFPCAAIGAVLGEGPRRRGAWLAALAGAAVLLAAHTGGLWRVAGSWHRAADLMRRVVDQLAEAARGKKLVVLTPELPDRVESAYAARNALPPAAWVFVDPDLQVQFLLRSEWDNAASKRAQLEAEHGPVIAFLRWDAALERLVGPDR